MTFSDSVWCYDQSSMGLRSDGSAHDHEPGVVDTTGREWYEWPIGHRLWSGETLDNHDIDGYRRDIADAVDLNDILAAAGNKSMCLGFHQPVRSLRQIWPNARFVVTAWSGYDWFRDYFTKWYDSPLQTWPKAQRRWDAMVSDLAPSALPSNPKQLDLQLFKDLGRVPNLLEKKQAMRSSLAALIDISANDDLSSVYAVNSQALWNSTTWRDEYVRFMHRLDLEPNLGKAHAFVQLYLSKQWQRLD